MALEKKPRKPQSEFEHWLGLGVEGQQSLLSDIDPYLYVSDAAFCNLIKSIHFGKSRRKEKTRALLIPPGGRVSWHQAFLAEMYKVYVWAEELDEVQEQAAERFSNEIIDAELPEELYQGLDIIALTNRFWVSEEAFRKALYDSIDLVGEEGTLVSLVACEKKGLGMEIVLSDDLKIEYESLFSGFAALDRPSQVIEIELSQVSDAEDYLRNFLKRHKDFFGADSFGPALEAIKADGIFSLASNPEAKDRYALLLVWQNY